MSTYVNMICKTAGGILKLCRDSLKLTLYTYLEPDEQWTLHELIR